MEGFGFGILHLLPPQIENRVINYLAGFRTNLGPKKASVYRKQQQAIEWQSYKQMDAEPDTNAEEDKPQDGQWQDYKSTWWERTEDTSAEVSYGNWQQRTSWRQQQANPSVQGHHDDKGNAQSSTWASSSISRASPYQENPWNERSAAWSKRDDWRERQ
jgi:hypothetical protein